MNNLVYDVIILGGGASGIAAAVGAIKSGARVALIERAAVLGGKASMAYVGTICGSYYRSTTKLGAHVCGGFPRDFVTNLAELSDTKPLISGNGLQFLPYDPFDFQLMCDKSIRSSNIDLYLQTHLVDVTLDTAENVKANLLVYNEPMTVHGRAIIDCSGDAFLSSLLGIEQIKSDSYQAAAQVFALEKLGNIPTDNLRLLIMKSIKKAVISEDLPNNFTQVSIVPGSHKNNRIFLKIGIPMNVDFALNGMTAINILARRLIHDIYNILKEDLECMKDARLGWISPEVGIRTGPRHMGRSILTKEDVLLCRKNPYSVARGSWPIEYWNQRSSARMEYFEMDRHYDISAECLQSDQINNLFFAGRNISADDEAIASARVIGTCLQTGYAAGILAAGFAGGDPRKDSIEQIKKDIFI